MKNYFKFNFCKKTDIFFIVIFILFLNYFYIADIIEEPLENYIHNFIQKDIQYVDFEYQKEKDKEVISDDDVEKVEYIDEDSLKQINSYEQIKPITKKDVEDSIKKYLPDFREFAHLSFFRLSEDYNKIIFLEGHPSSACCILYSYNLNTKVIERVPEIVLLFASDFEISPNKNYVLFVDNSGKELYVRNTETGEKKIVFELNNKDETLIKELGAYGGDPFGDFGWINDKKIFLNIFGINPKYPEEENQMLYYKEVDLIL